GRDAYGALQRRAHCAVNGVAQGVHGEDGDRHQPSPTCALKTSKSGYRHGQRQRRKSKGGGGAERTQRCVFGGLDRPNRGERRVRRQERDGDHAVISVAKTKNAPSTRGVTARDGLTSRPLAAKPISASGDGPRTTARALRAHALP